MPIADRADVRDDRKLIRSGVAGDLANDAELVDKLAGGDRTQRLMRKMSMPHGRLAT